MTAPATDPPARFWGALAGSPIVTLGVCLAVFFATAIPQARIRLLWNDELFTWHIAAQPRWSDVWAALLTGAEQMPPLFYAATRASLALFGPSEWALRLPQIAGFAAALVFLFGFVYRRLGAGPATAAAALLMQSGAFPYATEARPYGMVLGFASAAMFLWQSGAAWMLSAVLACALLSHYYAILLLPALAAAEWVRSRRGGEWRLRVWIAIGAAPIALLPCWPLLAAARGYSGHFWARPNWILLDDFYRNMIAPAGVGALAVVVVLAWSEWRRRNAADAPPGDTSSGRVLLRRFENIMRLAAFVEPADLEPQEDRRRAGLPPEEFALAAALALLPVLAFLLGRFVTGAFTFRYALPGVLGLAIGAAWVLHMAFRGRTLPLLSASALILAGVALRGALDAREFASERRTRLTAYDWFRQGTPASLPLVIASPHLFFELAHYTRRPDIVYLADPGAALRVVESDTPERGIVVLGGLAGFAVHSPREWLARHDRFLLAGYPGPYSWLLPELLAAGRSARLVKVAGERMLFEISPAR